MAKKRKSSLNKRYEKSYQTKDSGNSSGIFKFPSDVKFYKAKEGRGQLIIVPYVIKSAKHPLVASKDFEIGETDYVMDVWVHRKIGPGDVDVVCLKKNYMKACPVCEEETELKANGQIEEANALKASRRVCYNVVDPRKPEEGLLVFSTSHYLFEKELIEEARSEDPPVEFADIDDGSIVKFRGSKKKAKNNPFIEYKSFSFSERTEPLEEEWVSEAISFDEIMTVLSYEEIQKIFYGQDSDDESPATKKAGKKKRKVVEEEEDEEEDEEEEEENPPVKKAATKKTSAKKVSSKKTVVKKAAAKKGTTKKTTTKKSKEVCPHKHTFAVDWDSKPECDTCIIWDRCADAHDLLKG